LRTRLSSLALAAIRAFALAVLVVPAWCATTVLFNPAAQEVGPFPSNALTVASSSQKTGLQVNLPSPSGCTPASTATQCVNVELLNQLDGFSVNPRITVCFSAAVNVSTLSNGIFFVPVSEFGLPIGINQVIFDPSGLCAYAKPNQVLDQGTEYLLVVTPAVLDAKGKSVEASSQYTSCVMGRATPYCQQLAKAMNPLLTIVSDLGGIAAASVFTTLSATNWMEQARTAVDSGAIPGVGALAGPMVTFNMADVTSITWMPDPGAGVTGVNLNQTIPLNDLTGVAEISMGAFLSPLYINTSGPQAGTISVTPTNTAIPVPGAVVPVSFHVFLPSSTSQAKGGKVPVILFGHGLGDFQWGAATYMASTWAQKGYATIAFEILGHGYGPNGVTQFVTTNEGTVNVPTPGRGVQFVPGQPIGSEDGCIAAGAVATRDCARESALDLCALVEAIRNTNGLGLNLDPTRIHFTGQSFGSFYGTLFEAVNPYVQSATLNVGGGTQIDVGRLSPIARALGAEYLAGFSPSLLNVPPAPPQPYFNDSFNDEYVYRGQAVTASVPGALAIQAGFEEADWLSMIGDPLGFAAHLMLEPLSGVLPKSILVQFGLGDLEVPNPTESALVRAAGLNGQTWMLETNVAAQMEPALLSLTQPGLGYPIYPHRFLANPTFFLSTSPPLETAVGIAAQSQIADFFTTGRIPNPNQYFTGQFAGANLFEIPFPLPDMLNFLQIAP
jgi:hypothetical protein